MSKSRKNHKKAVISSTSVDRPGQNNKPPVGGTDTTSQEDDSSGGEARLSGQIHPPPTGTNKSKQKWYRSLQGWKSAIEMFAVPFAIGYAVITYFQWRDLRHNFEADERAWLKAGFSFGRTPSTAIPMQLTNIGKSPGLQAIADAVFEIVPSSQPPSFIPVSGHNQVFIPLLFPNESSSFDVKRPNNTPLTASEINSFTSGKSYIAVFGQVIYKDQFGWHWTRFCSWESYAVHNTTATFNANTCVAWNAVGEGKSPQ